jgi:transposase-like protein
MKRKCPNSQCSKSYPIYKDGQFYRRSDSKRVQRYKCSGCKKRFSNATFTLTKYQKKRRLNPIIRKLYCSKMSQNRIAKVLRIHPATVAKKLDYLAQVAAKKNKQFLSKLEKSPVTHLQFDDLITKENSKMKPLAVSLCVDQKRRYILSAQVSVIPAFGHLAKKSVKKYGKRSNNHTQGLHKMFKEIKGCVSPSACIDSDEHKNYPPVVAKYFPLAKHNTYKGGRGCVAGQGELKKLNYDPLFILNHTCAMLRDGLNRLVRKTWCTTKKVDKLQSHLGIFIDYFNNELLKSNLSPFM